MDENGFPLESSSDSGTPATASESQPDVSTASKADNSPPKVRELPWSQFVDTATDEQVIARFIREAQGILTSDFDVANNYCVLALLEPDHSIVQYDLNRVYTALLAANPDKNKDVLLILLSPGGEIEPAYRISKLCKAFSRSRFIVAIPRQAKSASTLLALGADEIHFGLLGELGPIDPQLSGLPALGVQQALRTIAALSEEYPKSAEMFARYLAFKVTVEQIGYCERIAESAMQYADRLLATKSSLQLKKEQIAKTLTQEYKDHGFVIDFAEARSILGTDWIKTDTAESRIAEKLHGLYDMANLYLRLRRSKQLLVIGRLDTDCLIFPIRNR